MRKTQTHRRQILGVQPIQKRSQLASNAPPQISLLVLARDRVDLDAELFGYRTREVRVDDDEVVLALPLPDHLVSEEFFEALAQFPVLERRDVFDGGCGRREAVQRLELESMHAHSDQQGSKRKFSQRTACSLSLVTQTLSTGLDSRAWQRPSP